MYVRTCQACGTPLIHVALYVEQPKVYTLSGTVVLKARNAPGVGVNTTVPGANEVERRQYSRGKQRENLTIWATVARSNTVFPACKQGLGN